MTKEQLKNDLIEDLRYQLFHKPTHRNWTSEHWYLSLAPDEYLCRLAIQELIAEGKIKKVWIQSPDCDGFIALALIPCD